jgi:outer membrane protein TolC
MLPARLSRLAMLLAVALAFPAHAARDLTLAEAQHLAVERSRQLDAQDASVASSRAMAQAAGALPDPVLKLGLDNLPIDGGDRFSLTRDFMTMRRVGVAQEMTGAGKRALRRERYEREADRTLAEKEAATASIQRDSAIAWLDRYHLEAMVAATGDFIQASKAEVESADSGYRGGKGAQADTFATRAALALAEDRRSDIERRLRVAKLDLARWIGADATQPLASPPAMDSVGLAQGAIEAHLGTHPEIVALDLQAGLATTEARIAAAARTPDWTWEAAFQQRGPAYSNMISIGVSIPLPWDRANRQDREVAAKLALVDEVRAKRDETLRMHVAEVGAMLDEWRTGRERQARYRREILPLSTERTAATLAAYAGGRSGLGEVLAARRGEFDARLQSLQLDLEVARVWARLTFLIPGGTDAILHPPTRSHEGGLR